LIIAAIQKVAYEGVDMPWPSSEWFTHFDGHALACGDHQRGDVRPEFAAE